MGCAGSYQTEAAVGLLIAHRGWLRRDDFRRRVIHHRGYGHHSAAAIIAMIHLCCGGLTIELPFK